MDKLTQEQLDFLIDRYYHLAMIRPMIMKNKYGIGQCGECLDGCDKFLRLLREMENED